MVVKIDKTGHVVGGGHNYADPLHSIARDILRIGLSNEADVTDNSGGTASVSDTVVFPANKTNQAASGTDLAEEADTQASILEVKDALETLFAKANALAALSGADQVTYNGGGTDGAGTVAAIDSTITGAATGVQATEVNAIKAQIDESFFALANLVNRVASQAGVSKMVIAAGFPASPENPVPESSGTGTIDETATGTAADPGVKASAMGTLLSDWADNAATVAAKINELTAAFTSPNVAAAVE